MIDITLPAIDVLTTRINTPSGVLEIPGQRLPERVVAVDPKQIALLIRAAREAAQHAYAPYSEFHVGAALVMTDDPEQRIYSGSNIENSAYGITNCAERSGLFHAASSGWRKIRHIAVSTADALHRPLAERSPCGACRQAIREFCSPFDTQGTLILIDTGASDTLCEIVDIDRLLPYGFSFAPTK